MTMHQFDPEKVTIVTTCMNRNEFLLESISTWLSIGFHQIIVVDWNSQAPVYEYLRGSPIELSDSSVTVIRSDQHARREYFNDGWARNTGARLAQGEYLFFMDSDIKIVRADLLFNEILLDKKICYRGNIPGGYGTCLVQRDKFIRVNGYSEDMWSWGGEDLDLYIRLRTQQGCEIEVFFPDDLLEHIHHDDSSRVAHRFQQWDDLKEGADIQRLEGPGWSPERIQQGVVADIIDAATGRSSKMFL